jgi:TPR repeat protein
MYDPRISMGLSLFVNRRSRFKIYGALALVAAVVLYARLDSSQFMWDRNLSLSKAYVRWSSDHGDLSSDWTLAREAIEKQDYASAFRLTKPAAVAGFAPAQFNLFYFYYNGYGVEKNIPTAMEWLKQAARMQLPQAKFLLGVSLNEGKDIKQDVPEAVYWLLQADKEHIDEAKYLLSQIFAGLAVGKYPPEVAFHIALMGAEGGNADAQFLIGALYQEGKGTEVNLEQAVVWYQRAVAQDNPYAMNNLAILYANGLGVKKDMQKALSLYGRAAEAGDGSAMYNLGFHYLQGKNIKRDYQKALFWYQKAAVNHVACAANDLGYMYALGLGIGRNAKLAGEWYHNAVLYAHEQGDIVLTDITGKKQTPIEDIAKHYAEDMVHKSDDHVPRQSSKRLDKKFYNLCWA